MKREWEWKQRMGSIFLQQKKEEKESEKEKGNGWKQETGNKYQRKHPCIYGW